MNEPNLAVTRSNPTADATEQLAGLLNRIGDALVAVDATALLAVEVEVGYAIAALGAVTDLGDRAATIAAARRVSTALLRCRRLGASFSAVARAMGCVGRAADGYDRAGSYIESTGVRSSVQMRA